MEKVVSISEVAHLWANQLQDEARDACKTFYFENRTIYSYGGHFPIAVMDENNNNIVYFTTREYSKTTSKHKYLVRCAASHKTLIYCKQPGQASRGYHAENIADFEANARNIAQSLPSSRKPEIYLHKIAQERESIKTYAENFGLDLTDEKYKLSFIWIESKDGGAKATEEEKILNEIARIEREKREAERAKEALKQHKKNLSKWRKFADKYTMQGAHLYSRFENVDYMRFNKVTNRIETSQGIEIPVEIAKNTYYHVLETIKTGGCVECSGKVLEYSISEINNKFIKVSCHTIEMKEIKAMAKLLKW